MYKFLENYKVFYEINLIILLKLIIMYNLLYKYIVMCLGFSFLYYYVCVFIVNKIYVGFVKNFLDRFVDKNMFFLFFIGNNCLKFLK